MERGVETYGIDMLQELSNYIFTSKYARYLEREQRRETWQEAVTRVQDMHLSKYDFLDTEDKDRIKWAFDMVLDGKVFPSMRSLQFGGIAVQAKNERIYNCAVRHVDSIRSFAEVFYLLLCGCGVGLGLSNKYLGRLPNLVGPKDRTGSVITYVIEDSIEGWADSIEALLNCYFINTAYSGRKIVFDYSKIRAKGTPLKTGGGKAPGYRGLKATHIKVKRLLDDLIEQEQLKRLRTIDAYDITMHCSDAVLSGGVRRSAMSVIFMPGDELMLKAKTGNWLKENPQRARSNNSMLLLRSQDNKELFTKIIQHAREWGEPGFVFADDEDMLFNPCFEVGFKPVMDDGVCAVQFCNLTSINGGNIHSDEDYFEAAEAASLIGTLQAGYTDFPYLSNMAKQLTKEEALLGVSMTGILDCPNTLLDAAKQQIAANIVIKTNARWANAIHINPAARTTNVKPEGTSSLVGKTMASGGHASHARLMFRRVQANKEDNIYKFFKQYNDQLCEPSVWSANETDDVITWPIVVPDHAIIKDDLDAISHLEIIKSIQKNWVLPGTTVHNKKQITHNVSCTVICKPYEWEQVTDYLYENKNYFAAVALISATGDKDYPQAPMEAVRTTEDLDKFNDLYKNYLPIDYTILREYDDQTTLVQSVACGGGACEVQ